MTPKESGLEFHHLGLAVNHPDKAVAFLETLGYTCGDELHDPHQNVRIIWCSHPGMPDVEILFPADRPGPLDSYLRMQPEMIYHLCFSAKDVQAAVQALRDAGHRLVCVSPPAPAAAFATREVSFYLVGGFGLIEILQA